MTVNEEYQLRLEAVTRHRDRQKAFCLQILGYFAINSPTALRFENYCNRKSTLK